MILKFYKIKKILKCFHIYWHIFIRCVSKKKLAGTKCEKEDIVGTFNFSQKSTIFTFAQDIQRHLGYF